MPPRKRASGPLAETEVQDLGEFDSFTDLGLSPEEAAKAEAQVERHSEAAERDLDEVRVNFRWGRRQVDLVKRAASAAGIPYQIYIKYVLFEHAMADLERVKALGD